MTEACGGRHKCSTARAWSGCGRASKPARAGDNSFERETTLGMTVSGVWSGYRRARPQRPPHLGRWHQVLADAIDQNLAIGVRAAVADHLGRAPTLRGPHGRSPSRPQSRSSGRPRVLHVPGADADANAGDRSYLVLAKPNLIMNDIRHRGLAVAETDPSGRKNPDNHAQTARNLRRTLRNAAVGARSIPADGLAANRPQKSQAPLIPGLTMAGSSRDSHCRWIDAQHDV